MSLWARLRERWPPRAIGAVGVTTLGRRSGRCPRSRIIRDLAPEVSDRHSAPSAREGPPGAPPGELPIGSVCGKSARGPPILDYGVTRKTQLRLFVASPARRVEFAAGVSRSGTPR